MMRQRFIPDSVCSPPADRLRAANGCKCACFGTADVIPDCHDNRNGIAQRSTIPNANGISNRNPHPDPNPRHPAGEQRHTHPRPALRGDHGGEREPPAPDCPLRLRQTAGRSPVPHHCGRQDDCCGAYNGISLFRIPCANLLCKVVRLSSTVPTA